MNLGTENELVEFINTHKKVILYGTGYMATSAINYLRNLGVDIVACLVSPGYKKLDIFHNLPVYETDNIPNEFESAGVLIAVKHIYYNQIAENLHRAGIKNYMMIQSFKSPFVEITTRIGCSLNCRYCPQHILLDKYFQTDKNRQSVMSLENFKQYLKKIPKHVRIVFSGMCEPFLNKDCSAMMKLASDEGYVLELATSLWGASQEDIKIMENINFDGVVLHLPDNQGATPLASDIHNHHELVKALLQMEKKGNKLVTGISCHGELHDRYKDLFNLLPVIIPLTESLHDRAGNLKHEELPHPHTEGDIYCIRAGMKKIDINVLLPDGTMILCCMDYGMDAVLGNLSNQTYEDIVYGSSAKHIIEDMHSGRDVICNKCAFAVQYEE